MGKNFLFNPDKLLYYLNLIRKMKKQKHLTILLLLLCVIGTAFAQQTVNSLIKGQVIDSNGEPIIGANVLVNGTTQGVITDLDGYYQLNVKNGTVLKISYMGYTEQLVKARQGLVTTLQENSELLDEVVVVGFGTQKKVNLTGAVASVSSEALENKPVGSIGQALEGVIPNLNVSAVSAQPNSVATFNVRGGTSMGQDSNGNWQIQTGSPLILVDGVQMDETYLSMLNPSDIESISLLKDAASAAIYGARATYGVLLVTTKGGKRIKRQMLPIILICNGILLLTDRILWMLIPFSWLPIN